MTSFKHHPNYKHSLRIADGNTVSSVDSLWFTGGATADKGY